ncbi:helix-turn-helix transcriptional regulator [Aureimonas sp. AU40]|uniref:helix-turn-helix transcriptional regulator n=1 Tax=Aureimonas sp. AU40 TaxID=1637747 RepID=UPI000784DAEF|nr:transcriptional regulator [Aureimonas sp. AU40]
MSDDRREDDLHDLIVEATDRAELWSDVLTALLNLSNSISGGLYIRLDPPPGTGQDPVVQAIPFQGYGAGMMESYNAHYHAFNPAEVHRDQLGTGRVITELDLAALTPGADLNNNEFFYDWCRPQNFHYAMGENLLNGETPLTLWVNRGVEAGSYGEKEQQRFHRLARSILQAVRTSERLGQAHQELDALRQALGAQGLAVLALDRSLRLRSLNSLAEEVLRREDGLRLRAGRVETVDPRDAPALEKAVSEVSAPILGLASPEAELAIRRAGAREPLKVSVTSTRGRIAAPASFDASVAIVLMFRYEMANRRNGLAALGAHFGLTPAELRLTAGIANGTPLREAALRLGISYETARSQLKAVFSKTQTRRQVELVSLLAIWQNL